MQALQRQQATGAVPDDRITVGAFLIEWLAGKKGTIRPGTYTRYEQLIRGSSEISGVWASRA